MSDPLRQQISEWWQNTFDGAEFVDVKVARDTAVAEFKADPEFCARFVDEFLPRVVYEVGLEILHAQRTAVKREVTERHHIPVKRVKGEGFVSKVKAPPVDFSKWMQHDPITGQHISLFLMKKEQAIAAAEAKEASSMPGLVDAAMLRLLAGRLQPGQTIGDVWSEKEVAQIIENLVVERPKVSLANVLKPEYAKFLTPAAD